MNRFGLILACLIGLAVAAPAFAQDAAAADSGNSCGEPETSSLAIVRALNAKIGQYGGPSQHVVAIRGAAPAPAAPGERHTRCHGTLVFDGGKTQIGLLLKDMIQGVAEWRWHSDEELAQGANSPAHQKAEAAIYDDMRRSAEKTPNETVHCGIEGPKPVYTTWAVCYAAIKFVKDNQTKLKPYAGYAILQECAGLDSRRCLAIIEEMRFIATTASLDSKMVLTEKCAADLGRRIPGNERPQYMNACQGMAEYFR